jgi:hypothetical protein
MEGSKSRVSCARHRRVLISCLQANGSDVVQRVEEMGNKSRIRGTLIVNSEELDESRVELGLTPSLPRIAVVVDGVY